MIALSRHKADLGANGNEMSLFHGTDSEKTVKSNCYQNFDPRVHGKNAVAHGRGTYFARHANYSHR